MGQHHYPFLPVRLLLRDRFATIEKIRRIRVPLLVIAGGRDRIVPIENSRRLYDAGVAPKTPLVIPDAGHNDHELLAGEAMVRAVSHFLQPLSDRMKARTGLAPAQASDPSRSQSERPRAARWYDGAQEDAP